MDDLHKRRLMISHIVELQKDPRWEFFKDYLREEVDSLLLDFEGSTTEKNSSIILGKIKYARNILHLDMNSINIMNEQHPE
jgi:hypothetical protein